MANLTMTTERFLLDDVASPMSTFECVWRGMSETYGKKVTILFWNWLMHTSGLIIFGLFWTVIDFLPIFKRYKLQPFTYVTWWDYFIALRMIFINSIAAWIPAVPALLLTTDADVPGELDFEKIPHWTSIVLGVWVAFIIEDFYAFVAHIIMHKPFIYKYTHKFHHENRTPFALAAEYTHPYEIFLLGPSVVIATLPTCGHLLSQMIFGIVRTWHLVVMHSGYDIWWMNPLSLMPGYVGCESHDMHHEYPTIVGNFAPNFTFWDKMYGTWITRDELNDKLEKMRRPKYGRRQDATDLTVGDGKKSS